MAKHRTRVGLHARNAVKFSDRDYALIKQARIETLKTLSITEASVYQRVKRENPDIEFIVRLYDDRLHYGSRPTPAAFVAKMVPIIRSLRTYTTKFEIHNEPNHHSGLEGWGSTDDHARSFAAWYMQVLRALKKDCPWAQFGFPGLALNHPHRDLSWLDICHDAIDASDWLGCHCYWQYGNMMADAWGLRFKLYHKRFPDKKIEVTEFGDSTPNRSRDEIATLYSRYYQELNKYPYLGSASAFIASSPDPNWAPFVWMKESGEVLPVVQAVRTMKREAVEVEPTERRFAQTGKTVRGTFLQFLNKYGLDICGYPITDEIKEEGATVQYFQRLALMEKSGKIQLKLVGSEAWKARQTIPALQARGSELRSLMASSLWPPPVVQDIAADLPVHATERYPQRKLDSIRRIVVHHTATSAAVTPQRLAEYHVNSAKKAGITYHFVVASDGAIYQTNRLETVSEHVKGHSADSIGVCFPGNFTDEAPPRAQLEAGAKLCAWLLAALKLDSHQIVGASELADTASPGKQWLQGQRWKDALLEGVRAASKQGLEEQIAAMDSLLQKMQAMDQPAPLVAADEAWRGAPEPAMDGEDSGLIASLRQQIASLQQELAQVRKQISSKAGAVIWRVSRPNIQDLIDKLAKHPELRYDTRLLSDIETIVIHHSAAPASVGAERIAIYHVKSQEWPGIGYHFVIAADGTIYQTNELTTISYHSAKVNGRGVGVCFLGDFDEAVPPPAQLRAGAHLVAWLTQELNLSLETVKGHREYMQTRCPGNQWLSGQKWKDMLLEEMARVQAEERLPDAVPSPDSKILYHYMLFWHHGHSWAEQDWVNAQEYIAAFQPTVGFSSRDAQQARYVTIVGGTLGVPQSVEDGLLAVGCRVDRVAGANETGTQLALATLVMKGKRFLNFQE